MDSIGSKLKFLIEQKNIKQNSFARIVNISPSRLSNYISNKRKPDIESLARMAKYLGTDLNYFSKTAFPAIEHGNRQDPECVKIKYIHMSNKGKVINTMIKINKFLLTGIKNPTENAVFIKVNKNGPIFSKGDYIIARRLNNTCSNNTVVLKTGSESTVYYYIKHGNTNLLVPTSGHETKEIPDEELSSYFAVIWVVNKAAAVKATGKSNVLSEE